MPFAVLRDKADIKGVGGSRSYYREQALLLFDDGTLIRAHATAIAVAEPSTDIETLPSLLGRPLLNDWRINFDPRRNRLEITVKNPLFTMRGDVRDFPPIAG